MRTPAFARRRESCPDRASALPCADSRTTASRPRAVVHLRRASRCAACRGARGHAEGKVSLSPFRREGQRAERGERRIGFAKRPIISEITHVDSPRTWGVRGIDGPIRAVVNVTVDPFDDVRRSRVTIAIDVEGHGIGKLLVPLVVRRDAPKEMPGNLSRLNERLESS